MIIISIQFTFASKDADTAEALFRELRDASVKEPGVIQFEVGRSHEKPNVFALWEVYRDKRCCRFSPCERALSALGGKRSPAIGAATECRNGRSYLTDIQLLARWGPIRQAHAGVLDFGYYEAGPTDGRVVLLLHGYPYDIHSFAQAVNREL